MVSNYSIESQQLIFEKRKKSIGRLFFYDVISANGRLPLCFRNTLYSWSFLRMCDTSLIPKFKVLMTMRWSKSRSENNLCLFRSNKGQGHVQNRFSSIGHKRIIFLIMYKNKKTYSYRNQYSVQILFGWVLTKWQLQNDEAE